MSGFESTLSNAVLLLEKLEQAEQGRAQDDTERLTVALHTKLEMIVDSVGTHHTGRTTEVLDLLHTYFEAPQRTSEMRIALHTKLKMLTSPMRE